MSLLLIKPSKLVGTINAPPSKSDAHRVIIAASLADGETCIGGLSRDACNLDIWATVYGMEALGAKIRFKDGLLVVKGIKRKDDTYKPKRKANIYCYESGTTLRLLMPIACALGSTATLSGGGELPNRPYAALADTMIKNGAEFTNTSDLPVKISGKLKTGVYEIRGDVSSQFVSGLLFALSALGGGSEIKILGEFVSKAYVDMTLGTLRRFGVKVSETENGYLISDGVGFERQSLAEIEGDYSGAAFFLTANALSTENKIQISGLSANSLQADKIILDAIKSAGNGLVLDAAYAPDLAPIAAVMMAHGHGVSRIENAGRLRFKECDRFLAICKMLKTLNVKYAEHDDCIEIIGNGGAPFDVRDTLDTFSDHRMVMAGTIALSLSKNGGALTDYEAVEKSYPTFFDDFRYLGGYIELGGI